MLLLSKAPGRGPAATGGALSTSGSSLSAPPMFIQAKSSIFSNRRSISTNTSSNSNANLTLCKADSTGASSPDPATMQTVSSTNSGSASSSGTSTSTVFVGEGSVPLEGVIQFEKPNHDAKIDRWGRVALLAGGDVLALLLFAAFGRFSHGFPVWDIETFHTADPFIAGWLLSAYFLGGYGEDGRGMNGFSKAVVVAAKSWALGIPLGIAIRAIFAGQVPQLPFILVSMGSTGFLLIGWRALLYSIFPNDKSKKNDVYRRGNPFELFELLTSLVRRW
uniref:Uncharacterized protein n=1 Tax=Kalanchoe fedtschenkoi TaxID=63787 RepID=A0A7N0TII8_KALFE